MAIQSDIGLERRLVYARQGQGMANMGLERVVHMYTLGKVRAWLSDMRYSIEIRACARHWLSTS